MCLILFAWDSHPEYRLVVAANRDEFVVRESVPMHWWDEPPILAGRDLSAGGTWLALASTGRVAMVTNVRDFTRTSTGTRSRGELPIAIAAGDGSVDDAISRIDPDDYDGYNLLATDLSTTWWSSNWAGQTGQVEPGVHGLSNAAVDTPWQKVTGGVASFSEALDQDDIDGYFEVLADRTESPDSELPDTGLPLELERMASARFIVAEDYGTCASTVLRVRRDGGFDIHERRFDRGRETGRVSFEGRF